MARFERLQNVSADYTATTTYTPPPSTPLGEGAMRGDFGSRGYFSFLSGNALYDRTLDDQTTARETAKGQTGELLRDVRAFNRERAESLSLQANDATHHGTISNTRWVPHDLVLDVALGLRTFGSEEWLTSAQVRELALEAGDGGKLVATRAAADGRVHRWQWDPAADYALTSYTIESNGFVRFEVSASDFERRDGLALPKRVVQRSMYRSSTGPSASRSAVLQVRSYKIDDAENTVDRYRIRWPKGTVVRDERIGFTFIATDTVPKPVLDDEIFRRSMDSLQEASTRAAPTTTTTAAVPNVNAATGTAAPGSAELASTRAKPRLILVAAIVTAVIVALLLVFRLYLRRAREQRLGTAIGVE